MYMNLSEFISMYTYVDKAENLVLGVHSECTPNTKNNAYNLFAFRIYLLLYQLPY